METSFHKHFRWIPDPRRGNHKLHNLVEVLLLSVIAVICGAESWYDMEAFGNDKKEFLKQFLSLEHGIPSHDTFNRVFMVIDVRLFERAFRAWTAELSQVLAAQKQVRDEGPVEKTIIAIDVKSVRKSACRQQGLGALHLVSAWSAHNQLVLGQYKVADKSNEITAIPELLSLLDIKDSVVTIDAMGTQKKIAEQIITAQGDYILSLKENQGALYEQVTSLFNSYKEDSYSQSHDKGHGRIEIRTCKVIQQLNWLDEKEHLTKLSSIIKISSERIIGEKSSLQDRYYISSLPADAAWFNSSVRSHWGIENHLHWQLDVGFGEDYNTTRNGQAAQNLALVRKMAINILKADKTSKLSLKARRLKAGWNENYLIKILANDFF
ncbi:ISAs1 family transposase [Mucilaginibacter psychrotolerans]|nr:ISAs1 family transposase [Mucilaginibacter psychrotolerans]